MELITTVEKSDRQNLNKCDFISGSEEDSNQMTVFPLSVSFLGQQNPTLASDGNLNLFTLEGWTKGLNVLSWQIYYKGLRPKPR